MEIVFFAILGFMAGDLFVIAVVSINIWNELKGIKGWIAGIETCISQINWRIKKQEAEQNATNN